MNVNDYIVTTHAQLRHTQVTILVTNELSSRSLLTLHNLIKPSPIENQYITYRSESISQPALSTVLPILVERHKDTSTTSSSRTLPPQSLDLPI